MWSRASNCWPDAATLLGASLRRAYQSEGRDEVPLQNVAQMREFLRFHLGDDWEIMLIVANAIAGPDATDDQVYAAQQRAVHLVRLTSPHWREELNTEVARAWLTLWLEP